MQTVVVCPTCRHMNAPGDGYCGRCWRRLAGSAAVSQAEAMAQVGRWQARRRLMRRVRWAGAALVAVALAVWAAYGMGAFERELPEPVSDIGASAVAGDWPMYLRDARHSARAMGASAGEGRLRWRFDSAEAIVSSPAVVDGRLYVGLGDRRVVALDADSGALLWERAVSGPVDSSPAVAGDSVFIGLRDGRALALDADSGALRWEFQTGGIFATAPVVEGGVAYIGSGDGALYTLDAQTGARRWTYRTGGHIATDPAINDEVVAALSQDGYLHIVDKRTGGKRLDYHARHARGAPALAGDWAYMADVNGFVTAIDWRQREWPLEKQARWLRTQLWAWGLGDLPPLKGLAWATAVRGDRLTAAPVVAADLGLLYVAAQEGRVHALDADTGAVAWTHETGGRLFGAPALAGDALLIGDRAGRLHALDARTGRALWRFRADAPITTGVAAANGMAYVGAENGSLYALE